MSRLQEARDVFHHIQQAWQRGQQTALLMITEVKGSAYRQPGSKMMMAADGQMFGMLSGGCLEGDLFGWAEKAWAEDVSLTRRYDLGENDLWSLGIGCKGSLEVLIAPVRQTDLFWQAVMDALRNDEPLSLILEIPSGARVLMNQSGVCRTDGETVPDEVLQHASGRAERRTRAEVVSIDGRRYVVDTIRPSERLIVAGAGHDAVPVVRLAASVGFAVTVLDPRQAFNNQERFPDANHLCEEPSQAKPDELSGAWWVIMNHHQQRDEDSLKLALNSNPRFIGVLGPLSRTKEMLANIGHEMADGPIHAPIGLDLAAETIEEVAVSIVSELMALRSNRAAAPLHGRERIHG